MGVSEAKNEVQKQNELKNHGVQTAVLQTGNCIPTEPVSAIQRKIPGGCEETSRRKMSAKCYMMLEARFSRNTLFSRPDGDARSRSRRDSPDATVPLPPPKHITMLHERLSNVLYPLATGCTFVP